MRVFFYRRTCGDASSPVLLKKKIARFLMHASMWFDFSLQSKVEESVEQSFGYYSGNDGSVDLQVVIPCGNPTICDFEVHALLQCDHMC